MRFTNLRARQRNLGGVQVSISQPRALASGPARRAASLAGGTLTLIAVVIVALLAGLGWLYVLRGLGWLNSGPNVADSLPLLQLAGYDGQPLLRVVVAWLLVGLVAGLALRRTPRLRRTAFAGLLALALLLLASQASYALARNLRFSAVVFSRGPGAGPWLEALAFAVGCALPGRAVASAERGGLGRAAPRTLFGGPSELHVSGGQDGNATQNDPDRDRMGDDRDGVRA